MQKLAISLTIYFDDRFWCGIFERTVGRRFFATKITFGEEPKDYEVYDFVLNNYFKLKFSPSIIGEHKKTPKNPKRIQREVKKQISDNGIGTKSQQALKLMQEQNKIERKTISKKQQKQVADRLFELRQNKKKEKHKGR